ncbi:MAG: hypothetical protein O7G87_24070, partial [bacterium]|nr:hypothetical protein [bacterium]
MPEIEANRFWVETDGNLRVCATVDLRLCYQTGEAGMVEGGNLWIFYDIRQYLERDQTFLSEGGVTVSGPAGVTWEGVPLVGGKVVRTFDIHPQAPEFLHAVHIICTGGKVGPDETITIWLKTDREGFRLPQNAIDAFRFWLVEDPHGELTFHHPGGKYHFFLPRTLDPSFMVSNPLCIAPGPPTDLRVTCPSISTGYVEPNLTLLDTYGNPLPHPNGPVHFRTRAGQTSDRPVRLKAPHDAVTVTCNGLETRSNSVRILDSMPKCTLYWGDIHGMQFNQRPLRDYFAWAKEIAHLDFSGGQLFSYSACIEEVWHQLLDAWREFTQPEDFISLPSIEFGTPPDGSHRLGFFPDTENLTPVFCEDRP